MGPAAETEDRILEAARAVFLRRGTAGARMQQIADEAGVNKALLHYYFDDKATLAEAVFRRAARELFPRVLRVLRSEAGLEEKVERVVHIELDHLLANPFLPGYLVTELHSQPGRARDMIRSLAGRPAEAFVPDVLDTLRRQLEEGARDGRFRPLEPEQFVINLISLCIFPFAAAPMLKQMFGLDDEAFRELVRERKRILPELVVKGMRP